MAKNSLLESLLKSFISKVGVYLLRYRYPFSALLGRHIPPDLSAELAPRQITPELLEEQLNGILNLDAHLKSCCANNINLAFAIDMLFWPKFNFPGYEEYPGDPNGEFDKAYESLESELYAQEFQKFACFHLFNLDVTEDVAELKDLFHPWVIREFPPDVVANLIGERTLNSFLSPSQTGKLFLVIQDKVGLDQETLYQWLSRRWIDAAPFRQILQYAKDSVVDVDYVIPYFVPEWVNEIHRAGLYFLGFPRRDVIFTRYTLTQSDCQLIGKMQLTYKTHKAKIEDFSSELRRAIGTAGNFYEDFHSKGKRVEQFASLIIALEALYTPSDQGELTFKIRQSCATMLGDTPEERSEIFKFLDEMFRLRGKLFHGKYVVSAQKPEEFVSDESLLKLASIVRRSILRFLALYLGGEIHLSSVQANLGKAAFDQGFGDKLRQDGSFDLLIKGST